IAAGNLGARVPAAGGGLELVELAHSFNSMAEKLETVKRELDERGAALQQAYSEAAEKNRAYLEMLGFVTHELKSPLASIVFGIGSLREGILGPLNDSQQAALRSAAHSADYLYATIANYLNLGRLEGSDLRLDLTEVPIEKAIVAPLFERLAEVAGERGVRLVSEVSTEVVVRCDQGLVATVFGNLVTNGIKYGRAGGEVRVGAQRVDLETWAFSVWNDGKGFATEAADRLFRKFSRLPGDRGDTKAGTGLGLYVSRQIVERHGGRIWAESEAGAWARFSFTLPAARSEQGPDA
ncbi:MAG: HAMP domain-containing histidine kinase, partial [Thermoanaerobaculia bacterium]|nr:HAMP domain-containing histidine kinase [Thermoanaerobaculia bacterium]